MYMYVGDFNNMTFNGGLLAANNAGFRGVKLALCIKVSYLNRHLMWLYIYNITYYTIIIDELKSRTYKYISLSKHRFKKCDYIC